MRMTQMTNDTNTATLSKNYFNLSFFLAQIYSHFILSGFQITTSLGSFHMEDAVICKLFSWRHPV